MKKQNVIFAFVAEDISAEQLAPANVLCLKKLPMPN